MNNPFTRLSNEVNAALSRLSPQDRKVALAVGGGALLLIIIVTSVAISSGIGKRERRIAMKLSQIEEVRASTAGFRAAEAERNRFESRLKGPPVRLFSLLEEQAKKLGLDIGQMTDKGSRPVSDGELSESSVEVNFSKIALDKLVSFLTEVERSQGIVKVTRLSIRPRVGDQAIDASMTATAYQATP